METLLRTVLKRGIRGKSAHIDPAEVLEGLEFRFTGLYPTGIPNTIWQIAEHMHYWVDLKVKLFEGKKITVPDGHVFGTDAFPKDEAAWEKFKVDYKKAIGKIEKLLDTLPLDKRWPAWGNGTTAEIITMIGNHNSYHAAQVVAMRRVLGVWR